MQGLFIRQVTSMADLGALSASLAGYTLLWTTFSRYIDHLPLFPLLRRLHAKLYPELCVTVPHYPSSTYDQPANELYSAVETYLASFGTRTADNLNAIVARDGNIKLGIDKSEEVVDDFHGVRLRWTHCSKKTSDQRQHVQFITQGAGQEESWYSLRFLRRHRKLVLDIYLRHVLEQAREMERKARKRRLYTNNFYGADLWKESPFEHPATFDTLAMPPEKKRRIMDDLATFRQSKEYYAKIGKAWKRGYLLHGPPGTGKSTMVAAMANFLGYDVYDLDLSAVQNNGQLRNLLASTGSKSVLVVEDIDCSLHLAGARKRAKQKKKKSKHDVIFTSSDDDEDYELESAPVKSEVTLSGLLNLIDGLWSVSQGERIIVFTTNHVDKLDPALIRRGRMDVHVEMSYCGIEALKILAKNYLRVEDHPMLEEVVKLVEEVSITPADVAEQLMPKTLEKSAPETVEACLKDLADTMKKMK